MKNLKKIPDINFRTRLKELFPNAFENELLDINNKEIIKCKKLYVIHLEIKDLTGIEYFLNLKYLYCDNNRLTSLPVLPDRLEELGCSENSLTNLPTLPDTLTHLACHNNILTTLPTLPDTLKSLYCSYNKLTSLPVLPITLEYLNCYYNNLTSLPNLPDTLEVLLSNNNMLPPTILPKTLKQFRWSICHRNKKDQIEGECLIYLLNK